MAYGVWLRAFHDMPLVIPHSLSARDARDHVQHVCDCRTRFGAPAWCLQAFHRVLLGKQPARTADGFVDRGQLMKNLRAVAVFFHHLLHAARLSLNSFQSPNHLDLDILRHTLISVSIPSVASTVPSSWVTHGHRRGNPQPLGAHAAAVDVVPKPTARAAVACFSTCSPPQSGQTSLTDGLTERTKTSNGFSQSSQ